MNYSGNVITKNPVQPSLTSAPGVWSLQEAQNAVANGTWPIPGVINPISKSLRFNSADSAYLNRTPASASNRKTWTWSGWFKRSALSSLQALQSVQDGGTEDSIAFTSPDIIRVYLSPVGGNGTVTDAVFRDLSAWYHVVVAVDTTQATAANRTIIYVNGVNVTSSSSNYISQNSDTKFNGVLPHYLGRYANQTMPAGNLNGYMTEVNFIDGQALTPSSFGLTDPNTGVWVPKKYTGTYGTNGFYLNFSDSNTTTLLGYDYSGNGNNWTPNNFSVTAGADNDSLTDVPTLWTPYNVTSDTGGVVRGNYCTLNPLAVGTSTSLANGNLDSTISSSTGSTNPSTFVMTSGKWYWEVINTATSNQSSLLGIIRANLNPASTSYTSNPNGVYYNSGGVKNIDGTQTAYGSAWGSSGVAYNIGVALDVDGGTVTFYLNGTTQGAITLPSNTFGWAAHGLFGSSSGSSVSNYNFGQRPFAYTPPSGYKSLCTTNLPTPTIGAASTALAGNYFNTVLYTGTGSALGVTGVGFQPDFVWIKSRSAATDHALYDAVRGVQKQLESNTTDAETTETQGLTAFDTNGFNLGTLAQLNTVNATYVGWNWNAGGSNATNTSGSITSTVRANTTAGFSIVTYTGTGANATVGHGLGVAPSMIIVKRRDTVASWRVYHTSIGNTGAVYLNVTDGTETTSVFWNNTSPTSSVFTIGTDPGVSGSGSAFIAYCFTPIAGYSAFGSYTGNGSADGPFVYLGFRPKFILFKRTNASGNDWRMTDTTRSTYNPDSTAWLYPNQNHSENANANDDMDILSNGFKIRVTADASNNNGSTYIYAAFAESPFKYANAR